eukprot:TRINITY_DN39435_c0_g1_i1.p2 TRINITY_DN39435_c0_g1~~TRINITY_DN39435_c0_g1_i1.p2  ORF type:complete len:255 (+),score=4.27 TRINITY_DN39435_c0_g1_i1:162-926(+)
MDVVNSFQWQRGITPLSSPYFAFSSIVVYLGSVFAIKAVVKKPITVPVAVPAVHNIILAVWSLIMFLGTAVAVIQESVAYKDAFYIVCLPLNTQSKGALFFWSYIYYLSKFYEFLDTILLALKAKSTSFLHVFHHAVVVIMAYLWVDQLQSLQHYGLLFNTAVHVVMYTYYFLCTVQKPPKWKQFITVFQIIQFVTSFIMLAVTLWMHYIQKRNGGCAGMSALAFNAVFNAILLYLFIDFFFSAYRKKRADKEK